VLQGGLGLALVQQGPTLVRMGVFVIGIAGERRIDRGNGFLLPTKLGERHAPQITAAGVLGIELEPLEAHVKRRLPLLPAEQYSSQLGIEVRVGRVEIQCFAGSRFGFGEAIAMLQHNRPAIVRERLVGRNSHGLVDFPLSLRQLILSHQAQTQERMGPRIVRRFRQHTMEFLRGHVEPRLVVQQQGTIEVGGHSRGGN
jgi:hypothetical protein